jgi:hypothetical protein
MLAPTLCGNNDADVDMLIKWVLLLLELLKLSPEV